MPERTTVLVTGAGVDKTPGIDFPLARIFYRQSTVT